jgi:hypothetical protein
MPIINEYDLENLPKRELADRTRYWDKVAARLTEELGFIKSDNGFYDGFVPSRYGLLYISIRKKFENGFTFIWFSTNILNRNNKPEIDTSNLDICYWVKSTKISSAEEDDFIKRFIRECKWYL